MRTRNYLVMVLVLSGLSLTGAEGAEPSGSASDRASLGRDEPRPLGVSPAKMQAMIDRAAADGSISDEERDRIFEYAVRNLPASEVAKVAAQVSKLRHGQGTRKAAATEPTPKAADAPVYETIVVNVADGKGSETHGRAVASDADRIAARPRPPVAKAAATQVSPPSPYGVVPAGHHAWSHASNGHSCSCGHRGEGCPTCGACDSCCACNRHQYHVVGFADALLLHVNGDDVPFAAPTEGCDSPHLGNSTVLNPDWDTVGFRTGVGVFDSCKGCQVTGTYWYYRSHDEAAAIPPAGLVLDPFLRHPDTVTCGPADEASAALAGIDVDFDIIDIDFSQVFCGGCNYRVAWLAGARWARIDQDFAVLYTALESSFISVPIDMRGAGPRFGLVGDYDIGHGLHVYARGIASVLSTRQDAQFIQTNVFAGTEFATGQETDRIVPVLDLELGVGYTCWNNHLTVRAGWISSFWFNMITAPGYIAQVHDNDFNASTDTLAFDGAVLRAEFSF